MSRISPGTIAKWRAKLYEDGFDEDETVPVWCWRVGGLVDVAFHGKCPECGSSHQAQHALGVLLSMVTEESEVSE